MEEKLMLWVREKYNIYNWVFQKNEFRFNG